MYLPNAKCRLSLANGTDVYGQPIMLPPITEQCRLIKAEMKSAKTSPRAALSGSESAANELVEDLVILLGPKTKARIDDVVSVAGGVFAITSRQAVYDGQGALNHFQLSGSAVEGD